MYIYWIMISLLLLLINIGCILILRIYQQCFISNEYKLHPNINVRNHKDLLNNWGELSMKNRSYSIIGKVVESVDEKEVKKHYLYLIKKRKKIFDFIISRKISNESWKKYIRYSKIVNDILKHQNYTYMEDRFNSLHYFSLENVCDGCKKEQSINILDKTLLNGLLLRKFEGNKETSVIYTPEERSFNLLNLLYSLLSFIYHKI